MPAVIRVIADAPATVTIKASGDLSSGILLLRPESAATLKVRFRNESVNSCAAPPAISRISLYTGREAAIDIPSAASIRITHCVNTQLKRPVRLIPRAYNIIASFRFRAT